jgi:hypothetical protein
MVVCVFFVRIAVHIYIEEKNPKIAAKISRKAGKPRIFQK